MRNQAQLAIDMAQVIIFVTDMKSGVTSADKEVALMLQKCGKPVVLCVNKCDNVGEPPMEIYEFYNLGLGDPMPVSSVHCHGTGDMLDKIFSFLDFDEEGDDENSGVINVAVIGKPNVGKSSLINRISGQNRAIVSDISGTTRDAIDFQVDNDYGISWTLRVFGKNQGSMTKLKNTA